MTTTPERLSELRHRAEAALKQSATKPTPTNPSMEELIHEMSVYQVELEMQLEDFQQSYRARESAQERYANLFDFAPVGYIETDTQGIVTSTNVTASNMLGMTRDVIEDQPFAAFISADFQDIYHVSRRKVLSSRLPQTCEVQLLNDDGSLFYAQLNIDLADSDSNVLRTSITNTTAIKETEEALRRALNHEKNLNQIRLSVLTTISHEFRTPLTTILSSVEILERYGDKLTDDKKLSHFETIRGFASYLNDTIQDATSIEQLSATRDLRLEEFDVIAFTRRLLQITEQVTANGRTINFELVAEHEQEVVRWDPSLYRRIVMNLLNNALKYSSEAIRCVLECTDNTICLQVQDDGDGISEAEQQHIFEAFYRGKNAAFIPGIGIGLQVVQRAVEAHGGTIRFESQPGQGATFMVEMPRWVQIE